MSAPGAELAENLRTLAQRVAREAGELVREGRHRGIEHAETKSSATDLVTEWDRAAERLLVQRLVDARPDDGIVGEEGTGRDGSSGITWLIDPIDGTTNFYYALPTYAVSVAACDAHGPLAGAVYVPGLDWMFSAARGGGAWLGTARLACGNLDRLDTALVATGFSYDADRRARQAQRLAGLLPRIRDIRRFGAASVDLCLVAAGNVDAYYEVGLGPWDIAAGALIAREAGCRVSAIDGSELRTEAPIEILAANPLLHERLLEALRPR